MMWPVYRPSMWWLNGKSRRSKQCFLCSLSLAICALLLASSFAQSKPPQAPRPAQAPPIEEVSVEVKKVTPTCDCSTGCTCGCQQGEPCRCATHRVITPVKVQTTYVAPVYIQPMVQPTPQYVPQAQTYVQPQPQPLMQRYIAPTPTYYQPMSFQPRMSFSGRSGGC